MPWSALRRLRAEGAEVRALATLPDTEFLAEIYLRYLGRDPDEAGRRHYLALLRSGRSRLRVLRDIRRSHEASEYRADRERLEEQGGFVLAPEPLVSAELRRGPTLKPRLTLLGTCVAEGLLRVAKDQEWPIVHHLLDSSAHPNVPDLSPEDQDAILVHLTLRSLLAIANAQGDGDLFHARADFDYISAQSAAQEALSQFVDKLLEKLPAGIPVFFLALLEPPPQQQGILLSNRQRSLYRLVRDLNDTLEEKLAERGQFYYLEINDIRQYYGDADTYDGYTGHFTHASLSHRGPQGRRMYQEILRRVEAAWTVIRARDPVKLIITDLDNTLWRGILAEEEEIVPWQHTEGWPLGYAEALLTCKQRGILLAICSKNDEAPTLQRFSLLWGQRLRQEDFGAMRINWQPKSRNVAEILQATNILPEHSLFIDDNPLEIEEVRRVYPQMRFLTGNPERWRRILLYAPETQVAHLSAESRQRTELIQASQSRAALATELPDRASWLQSLGLRLTVQSITGEAHPRFARALELLNKTNQFNTTGERWTAAELLRWLTDNGQLLAGTVEDRFAQHGLVVLALWRGEEIRQMVLSCRVFGLDLESALLAVLQGMQRKAGLIRTLARFQDTGRNGVCRDFWPKHGFNEVGPGLWQSEDCYPFPAHIQLDRGFPS